MGKPRAARHGAGKVRLTLPKILLDIKSSYPTNGSVCNVSKENTVGEVIRIAGVDRYTGLMQGLNLSAGQTNAVEIATSIIQVPELDKLDQLFKEHLRQVA